MSQSLRDKIARVLESLSLQRSTVGMLGMVILVGMGEPTRKALIMDLAPDSCKAGMFGLYYLIRDVIVSIAAFGGAFLWQARPQLNFMTAFVFGVIGTLGFAVFGRDIQADMVEIKPP